MNDSGSVQVAEKHLFCRQTMHHWWMERQGELQALAEEKVPLLVYNEEILNDVFFDLLAVPGVEGVFQSLESDPYDRILQKAWELGAGFQCTSLPEREWLFRLFPDLDAQRLLFVPAEETRHEAQEALTLGMKVVVGPGTWRSRSDLFKGHPVLVRVSIPPDPFGSAQSISGLSPGLFGIYLELHENQPCAEDLAGLIAYLHKQAGFLPDRHVLCLARGKGLPLDPQKDTIMTGVLCDQLEDIRECYAGVRLWLEPGRHLLSHAGILLAKAPDREGKNRTKETGVPPAVRLRDPWLVEQGPAAVYALDRPEQAPWRPEALGNDSLFFPEKGGILVITNQGWNGVRAEAPLSSVAKRFLKARRICRVKL